jgi:hypothetical protein
MYLPKQWGGPVKTLDQRSQEETESTQRAKKTHEQENKMAKEKAAEEELKSRLTPQELFARKQAIHRNTHFDTRTLNNWSKPTTKGGKRSKRCKRNKTNNNKNKKSTSRRHKKCKCRITIKK